GQEATGVIYSQVIEGQEHILLFFSKAQGSSFRSKIPQSEQDKWSVRGMTQHGLRFFLLMTHAADRGICVADPFSDQLAVAVDQQELARDYYYGSTPIREKDWSVRFSSATTRSSPSPTLSVLANKLKTVKDGLWKSVNGVT